jgi:hypothetical protein
MAADVWRRHEEAEGAEAAEAGGLEPQADSLEEVKQEEHSMP